MSLFKKAQKSKSMLRLAIAGPSGSGKVSMTALLMHVDVWKSNIAPDGDCLIWTAGKTKAGYGMMPKLINGKRMTTHRYSYALANDGELPQVVRHTCDNPACVKPEHLLAGSHADNVHDRIARGRPHGRHSRPEQYPRGEMASNAKLTSEQVKLIRDLYQPRTVTTRFLATKYGVGASTIKRILNGQENSDALAPLLVRSIREEYRAGKGYSTSEIAQRFGVSKTVIKHILAGRTWKGVV